METFGEVVADVLSHFRCYNLRGERGTARTPISGMSAAQGWSRSFRTCRRSRPISLTGNPVRITLRPCNAPWSTGSGDGGNVRYPGHREKAFHHFQCSGEPFYPSV